MAQKRWEKYRRAAVREIVEEAKSINPAVATSADAYGILMANQWNKLMDDQKPNVIQAEKLGRMLTGMDAEPQRDHASPPPGAIIADPDTMVRLMQLMEADKQQAVDQARAVDGAVSSGNS
jgi:hypothetical protein